VVAGAFAVEEADDDEGVDDDEDESDDDEVDEVEDDSGFLAVDDSVAAGFSWLTLLERESLR
jgi:hypothetical protein